MLPIVENIKKKIYTIRGKQVMLDSDLAELFGTETKYINRALKRNPDRFPSDFAFVLTEKEWQDLRFQIGTLEISSGRGKFRKYLPFVFTEQGVAMLSSVLQTDVAIEVSIQIIRAFIVMRKTFGYLHGLLQRMELVELKQLETDTKLENVFKALEKDIPIKQGIFFEGQLFDAHIFVSKLIKKARNSLIVIDNYINEETLLLLSKRQKKVKCVIHTRINPVLISDLEKHNKQYPIISIVDNRGSHDRFLTIDHKELYHLGASLKDLGNKCFAFSRMDNLIKEIQHNLIEGG